MATQDDFQRELDRLFRRNADVGERSVVVSAGQLHAAAQDGAGNRVPNCCRVMRKNMRFEDRFLNQPRQGDGTRLQIEYQFPR